MLWNLEKKISCKNNVGLAHKSLIIENSSQVQVQNQEFSKSKLGVSFSNCYRGGKLSHEEVGGTGRSLAVSWCQG